MAQPIGLIDPCPIDDLSAVAGDNVEQVVDDLGLATLSADLLQGGGVHVHGHSLDPRAALVAQEMKKGACSGLGCSA